MTMAPVGLRCPEHSGKAQGAARITGNVKRASFEGTGALVTKSLIAINVLVFLINLAQGASLSQNAGSLYEKGVLVMREVDSSGQVVGLAEGEYWRLLSAAFLHGSIVHLGLNMLMLWWIGAPMEAVVGRGRFLAIYLVSGLAGSAGALVASPNGITVGASGAIFGILGAALVFERQRTYVLGGSALSIILLNLVFTFAVPNISIGGHVGGLAGGVLSGLAITRLGRVHAAYGRPGLLGVAGVVAVGLLSVLVAYMKVQQYV
jgi:membrane associated rhomboid family serine protease